MLRNQLPGMPKHFGKTVKLKCRE